MARRLRDDEDAFGHALRDYLRGRTRGEIIERSDGFIQPGPGGEVYFAEYRDWAPHERAAVRYVRGRVLDVGCGAGRHALHLQRRGHRVLGIDVSPLAVRICRLRGVREARRMSLDEVSPRLGRFDTVLMLGANLGLVESARRAPQLLRRLHAVTSAEGRIIAGTLDPYRTREPEHRAYHRWNRRRGRMGGQIRMRVRYRSYVTPWFDYLFVSPQELRELVRGTGWRIARILRAGRRPQYVAVLEKDTARPASRRSRRRRPPAGSSRRAAGRRGSGD